LRLGSCDLRLSHYDRRKIHLRLLQSLHLRLSTKPMHSSTDLFMDTDEKLLWPGDHDTEDARARASVDRSAYKRGVND
jgi:hypothetical protein